MSTLEQKCKKYLEERENCCKFCGFNFNKRIANLYKDCLPNKCKYLIKEIKGRIILK